jgi:hypothetical protein
MRVRIDGTRRMMTTSGRAQRAGLMFLAAVVAALCLLPVGARANPAVDEYIDRFPTASGKDHGNAGTPTGNLAALPPGVAAKLARDPNGTALAAIATASSLGAPALRPGDTGSGTSLLHALLDPVILILALAVIAIVAITQRARRRGAS